MMDTWSALSLLGPEEKWSGLRGPDQFLYSIIVHGLILGFLIVTFSRSGVINRPDYHSIEFELLSYSSAETPQINKSFTAAVKLPAPEEDLSNPLSAPAESLPKNFVEAEARIRRVKPVLRSPVGSGAKLMSATKSSTLSSSAASAGKTAISDSQNASSSVSESQQAEILPPDAIGLSNPLQSPLQRFAELDAQACSVYVQGEAAQSADRDKARKLWNRAIEIMNLAIPILSRESGPESAQMAEALQNVGRCYDKLEDYKRSSEYYERAAEMYSKVAGINSSQRGIALVYLADALISQNELQKAEAQLLLSLPIYKNAYGDNSKYVAWTYTRLGKICRKTERLKEADDWQGKAAALLANGN